ncbi:hypothetical protein ACWDO7_22920 [Streptomyces sp. NPDC003656]
MISDAFDAMVTLGWAFLAWIGLLSAGATAVLFGLIALVRWAVGTNRD